MDKTQNYISENKERFLEELLDLLRIPSISADPEYAGDVQKTAEHIAESLTKLHTKCQKITHLHTN